MSSGTIDVGRLIDQHHFSWRQILVIALCTLLMMLDGFEPIGVTILGVDSIFMMPQLGVLAQVHPEAATHVFLRDCLIPLGACIAALRPASTSPQIFRNWRRHPWRWSARGPSRSWIWG